MDGPLFSRSQLLPDSTREQWLAQEAWLAPRYWDPETDGVLAPLQTYVIRVDCRIIVVDTGIGNDKSRPSTPPLDQLHGPYLERLQAIGVSPEAVDTVVCTHLHPDHVGWNTRRTEKGWTPTFPNARYLLPAADYRMLVDLPSCADLTTSRDALADSVQPVIDSGLADFWEGDALDLDEGVRLVATPGHSPGSAVVVVESGSTTAILSGDIVHHPMQILDPDQATSFDADPAAAVASRHRILRLAGDANAVLLPAHLPGPHVPRIATTANGFTIAGWEVMPV
jgi:glyoxylase-like metal-dependent hydrolase (beta-lactamase superfamily II)